jgi:hypothetical protein
MVLYSAWKAAVDDISDIEGLYPTFVLNILPRSAITVSKTNGIGNVWGLDDTESLICKLSFQHYGLAVGRKLICNGSMAILYWLGIGKG